MSRTCYSDPFTNTVLYFNLCIININLNDAYEQILRFCFRTIIIVFAGSL